MAFEIVGESQETTQMFEKLSEERKALQTAGLLPEWYTTQAWQMFKTKYAVPGEEGVKGRHRKVAQTLARHMGEDSKEWEEKFFNLLWSGILSPASPALGNTGTKKGQPVSCSGQFVGDSIDSFYQNLHETACLSKQGFGTSADFSSIRPRGSPIAEGGTAHGPVPVIEDFFTCAAKVSQGGNRRGSIGAYLDIDHPDWDEAVDGLEAEPDGKNYGWVVRDDFIQRLKEGDEEAQRRWSRLLYVKMITGKGYVFKVDAANRKRPMMYKDLNLDVKATNLCCMTGDQRVVTSEGIKTVLEMYEEGSTNLLAGRDGMVEAGPMLLPRPDAPIVRIETKEGFSHKVTPDHRVAVKGKGWVEAQDLEAGDKLELQNTQGVFGDEHNPDLALIMGLVAGDGTYNDHSVLVDLWDSKTSHLKETLEKTIAELVKDEPLSTNSSNNPVFTRGDKKWRLSSAPLNRVLTKHGVTRESKLRVPELVWKGDRETQAAYLKGLYIADGHIESGADRVTITLASTSKELLEDLQILWLNLGARTSIAKLGDGGVRDFGPERGGAYECKESFRLICTGIKSCRLVNELTELSDFRSSPAVDQFLKRLNESDGYSQKDYATFTHLTELPNEDAYCLEVFNDDHAWTVNGLITHNTEIMLHSSEDYTYSCILSSLNLTHWDTIVNSDAVFDSTVFLDCLVSEFLESSKDIPGMEKVRRFTEKGRAVGLGVMGFATMLQQKGLPFASFEANMLNNQIFKHIHDESLRASKWLAEKFGEPEWCKGYGVRATHRTALAPTKSTSLLMGGVSESVFPDPGMVFDAGSSVGELRRITPVLYELMKERGVYSDDTISDIINNGGSVQHVDWLSEEEKMVFLTAFEIPQDVILRYASARQKWLCQGQSLNFFFADEGAEEAISRVMTKVLLDDNILGQYYIYSKSGVVVKDECIACQA